MVYGKKLKEIAVESMSIAVFSFSTFLQKKKIWLRNDPNIWNGTHEWK